MYAAPWRRLAAVQVGVRGAVVLDTAKATRKPDGRGAHQSEIVSLGGGHARATRKAGPSIPDVRVEIERPETVTVRLPGS